MRLTRVSTSMLSKVVAKGVNSMRSENRGFLVITHYQRLLDYIKPDHVHVMADGQIVKSGGAEFALELEESGYDFLKNCLIYFVMMNSETATVQQVAFEKDDVGNFSFPEKPQIRCRIWFNQRHSRLYLGR